MIIHCKNTLGDGTVLYVDYEAEEPTETEATESDYIDALNTLGVDTNEEN